MCDRARPVYHLPLLPRVLLARHRRARLHVAAKPRKCKACGKRFTPLRSHALTCSSKCRQARYMKRLRGKRSKNSVDGNSRARSGTIAARAGYHGMDRGDQPKPSSTMKRRSSGLRSVAGQMPPLQLFLPVHSAPLHSFIGVGAA